MGGKIDLIDEQDHRSYVLKIYVNESDQPKFLLHYSYINKPKKKALEEAQQAKKQFSKTYTFP